MKIDRFTGINNRQPIDRIKPTDAGMPVRDAVNVDLSESGTFQRRPGFRRVVEMTGCRDIWETASGALFASGDRLHLFDGQDTSEVATLGSAFARVAYADSALGTIWSDGFTLNVLSGSSQRLAPQTPNPQPLVSGEAGGSLVAGTYGVIFATIRSDGKQSPHTLPWFVSVPANGRIQITATGHTQRIAVFVTAVDGAIYYRQGTIEVGQSSMSIPFATADGQPIKWENMSILPAGKILAVHKGRLLSADGAFLFYSLPWALGLYRPASDYIALPEEITLVQPVEGGVYLATDKATYFLPGGDISQSSLQKIAHYGAVKGTAARLPNSLNPMWHTSRGPVQASQDGALQLMQDKQIAYPSAQRGASIQRESNGLRQFITSLSQSQPLSGAVFGSYMEARVISAGA